MLIKYGDAKPVLGYVDEHGDPVELDENGNIVKKAEEPAETSKQEVSDDNTKQSD